MGVDLAAEADYTTIGIYKVKEDPMSFIPHAKYPRSTALQFFNYTVKQYDAHDGVDFFNAPRSLYRVVSRLKTCEDMERFCRGYSHYLSNSGTAMPEQEARRGIGIVIWAHNSTIGLWWRLKWWFAAGVGKHKL